MSGKILTRIFVDHFLIATIIVILLTTALVLYRVFKVNFPFGMVLSIWYLIMGLAAFVLMFVIIDFFLQGEGLDRLASIPLLLGVSPLFLGFLISIFLYPQKQE